MRLGHHLNLQNYQILIGIVLGYGIYYDYM